MNRTAALAGLVRATEERQRTAASAEQLRTSLDDWLDRARERTKRILVVEDHALWAEGLCRALRRRGHEPTIAASAEAGLMRAREDAFDGVVVDLLLPGMSGAELIEELRRASKRPLVPIVVLTVVDADKATEVATRAGATAVVSKDSGFEVAADHVSAVVASWRGA